MVVRAVRKANRPVKSNATPAATRMAIATYCSPAGMWSCGPSMDKPHIAAATKVPTSGGGILFSSEGMSIPVKPNVRFSYAASPRQSVSAGYEARVDESEQPQI